MCGTGPDLDRSTADSMHGLFIMITFVVKLTSQDQQQCMLISINADLHQLLSWQIMAVCIVV